VEEKKPTQNRVFVRTDSTVIFMKKTDKLRLEAENTMRKIRGIAAHIRNVQDNCLTLGEKLIERGEVGLGRKLIANGFVHDASKFHGIEFDFMAPGTPTQEETAKLKLKMAVQHHSATNSHHPEAWGNIHRMPRIAVAEMVADWKSRSEEFGTSLRDYIDDQATKRFGFSKNDTVYKEIEEFVNLLCPKPFETLNPA
jgi:hypothetical protein